MLASAGGYFKIRTWASRSNLSPASRRP